MTCHCAMNRIYDQAVGYSSLECVDLRKLQQLIGINKTIIDEYYIAQDDDLILVAGAGVGYEAQMIQEAFRLRTFGIDLNIDSNLLAADGNKLQFQKMDLTFLAFPDDMFALIYCYHVLEHVQYPKKTLGELHRVLSPGGIMFIGFPNKNRVFSYFGTSQRASLLEKIQWNLNDYRHRIRGTFENECGAHAGFSERGFMGDSLKIFSSVIPVRNQYMLSKYSRFRMLIKVIIGFKLAEILFPSNYFICKKE